MKTDYISRRLALLWVALTVAFMAIPALTWAEDRAEIPVPGMVTMVDLGAKKCIPCKMMAPILDELQEEYKNRAAIIFIDVWENPGVAKQFGIRAIPTQIFYDSNGVEIMRHVGFFDKAAIEKELRKLGVQ